MAPTGNHIGTVSTKLKSKVEGLYGEDANDCLHGVLIQFKRYSDSALRTENWKKATEVAEECPGTLTAAQWWARSRVFGLDGLPTSVLGNRVIFLADREAQEYLADSLGNWADLTPYTGSVGDFYGADHSVTIMYSKNDNVRSVHCTMRNRQAAKVWACEERGPVVSTPAAQNGHTKGHKGKKKVNKGELTTKLTVRQESARPAAKDDSSSSISLSDTTSASSSSPRAQVEFVLPDQRWAQELSHDEHSNRISKSKQGWMEWMVEMDDYCCDGFDGC